MTPAMARITLLAGGLLLVALNLPGCGDTCDGGAFGGSCIEIGEAPEPPTCAELVTDECVPEVIEAFCPVVETQSCPPPTVRVIVVYADPDTGECDLTIPVGHRPIECRGKGHE